MRIPATLVAGDSASWIDAPTLDNLQTQITSDVWTLKYSVRGNNQLDLTAVPSGSGWKTSVDGNATKDFTPGQFFWQAFVENVGGERRTLGSGQIEIKPNLSKVTGVFDGRSQVEKDLAAVTAAIRGIATGGVQSYTIGGRQIQKMSMSDLLLLQQNLRADVSKERRKRRQAEGLPSHATTYVRFRK